MKEIINPADKLILALDGMNKEQAFALISKIPGLKWVKVGLELFVSEGPEIVNDLRDLDLNIFLDLKFHDIPTTMAAACRQAAKTGANLITVHASAGYQALVESNEAAIFGAKEVGLTPPRLLAVTILTSWKQKNLENELAVNQSIKERVEMMAKLAFKAGIGGCICSPQEVAKLRELYSEPFELITPGIRLDINYLDDQARVLTPYKAIKAGATRLVIGRPVTKSSEPLKVFNNLCGEVVKAHLD